MFSSTSIESKMEIFFLLAVAAVALIFYSMQRGKKAVRAFIYLAAMEKGATEHEANVMASRLDLHAASNLNDQMRQFVQLVYGDSQLAMISAARRAGFRE
jgi:hypothetical protein